MIGKHTLVVALGHWLWNNQWVCGAIFVPARKLSTATYGLRQRRRSHERGAAIVILAMERNRLGSKRGFEEAGQE
jgi:hypothetical protein